MMQGRDIKCWICDTPGHIIATCPHKHSHKGKEFKHKNPKLWDKIKLRKFAKERKNAKYPRDSKQATPLFDQSKNVDFWFWSV